MKKLLTISMLTLLVATGSILKAQDRQDDYLGLPGDNLNLYAVMNLFQNSKTLEEFERNLNDENSRINNLDLNGDNMIDYIAVADHVKRGVHNIVLSVSLNSFEKQDLAVFTVERFRNGSVQIQLIGDEALYGRNYIVEPIYADNDGGTSNPGYTGSSYYSNNDVVTTTYVEVATWPLISYIFRPDYVVWNSSWYWGYYPSYWHAWSPYSWHFYYGYHCNWYPDYYRHYRHWNYPRYAHYNDYYYRGVRSHSIMVADRIREGHYRNTYSHPEQRRDGEALYSRTHSDRRSTLSGNFSNSNRGTRSSSGANIDRSNNGRNYSSSRRSNNSYTGSPVTTSSRSQSTRMSNRSGGTVSERSINRSFTPTARTNNRSAAPSTNRIVSKREMRGETASSARKSNVNVSSQNRRADREVRSGGSVGSNVGSNDRSNDRSNVRSNVRSNDRSKSSDNSNTSRRR